jgi:hypothetical protein
MKRANESIAANSLKRLKQDRSNLIDTFIRINLSQCSECQKERVEDCINVDFLPRIYFTLAITMNDPTCRFLLRNDDDLSVRQINDYAYKLSLNDELTSLTLSKLDILCSNFTTDVIQELASLLSSKGLHEKRELKFIGDCLEGMVVIKKRNETKQFCILNLYLFQGQNN